MMAEKDFGFTEIEHTADWALKVWAPALSELFAQAAEGMYWLMETTLQPEPRLGRTLALEGSDLETLLVSFLAELLYLSESEGIGFDHFEITIQNTSLIASVGGAPVIEQKKEIKAVTYHNLAVRHTGKGFEVTIVFDV